jgi:hypothetical protein
MKFEVEGQKELNRVLKSIPEKGKKAAEHELDIILLDLQGKAQDRAPVLTGDLRGSAYHNQKGLTGEVGFSSPYALRQHEELSYRHPQGGEAKYLENPYKENAKRYIKAIGDAVKKAVD